MPYAEPDTAKKKIACGLELTEGSLFARYLDGGCGWVGVLLGAGTHGLAAAVFLWPQLIPNRKATHLAEKPS
jgi:hypothetical protein